jgi:hypothetical protein
MKRSSIGSECHFFKTGDFIKTDLLESANFHVLKIWMGFFLYYMAQLRDSKPHPNFDEMGNNWDFDSDPLEP